MKMEKWHFVKKKRSFRYSLTEAENVSRCLSLLYRTSRTSLVGVARDVENTMIVRGRRRPRDRLLLMVATVGLLWVVMTALLLFGSSEMERKSIHHHLDAFQTNITRQVPSTPLSACLLIKDDNEILNEWIAYHYHVLNMRHLLVAVDPSSLESPSRLLQRWERQTREIGDPLLAVVWSDPDYMPQEFLKKGYHIPPRFLNGDAKTSKWHEGHEDHETVVADKLRINNHRFRQVTFLSSCFRYMRSQNRTWTVHIDTDEYVVVNPFLRKQTQRFRTLSVPDSPREASSVMKLLQGVVRNSRLRSQANYPCISMPRLLFGSVEDGSDPQRTVLGRKATELETLRWKYHTSFEDKERNAQPKVIVDVSAVPDEDEMFRPKPFSIHRPSKALCRRIDQLDFHKPEKFPLSVQHYLGSWERYYARNDTRRSKRVYEFKAEVSDGREDWIASWVDGFVQRMGQERAKALLFNKS